MALLFGLGILKAVVFNVMILKSNNVLHGHMLDSVLRAPLRFFDTNSIGNCMLAVVVVVVVHISK